MPADLERDFIGCERCGACGTPASAAHSARRTRASTNGTSSTARTLVETASPRRAAALRGRSLCASTTAPRNRQMAVPFGCAMNTISFGPQRSPGGEGHPAGWGEAQQQDDGGKVGETARRPPPLNPVRRMPVRNRARGIGPSGTSIIADASCRFRIRLHCTSMHCYAMYCVASHQP